MKGMVFLKKGRINSIQMKLFFEFSEIIQKFVQNVKFSCTKKIFWFFFVKEKSYGDKIRLLSLSAIGLLLVIIRL